jgi:hypothetical protein
VKHLDLTGLRFEPRPVPRLNGRDIEAAKKSGRLLMGGGSLFYTPVGGVILGPVIIHQAYQTMDGWAQEIKCDEGEALVRTSRGSAWDFACWRVVPVSVLPPETIREWEEFKGSLRGLAQ